MWPFKKKNKQVPQDQSIISVKKGETKESTMPDGRPVRASIDKDGSKATFDVGDY